MSMLSTGATGRSDAPLTPGLSRLEAGILRWDIPVIPGSVEDRIRTPAQNWGQVGAYRLPGLQDNTCKCKRDTPKGWGGWMLQQDIG